MDVIMAVQFELPNDGLVNPTHAQCKVKNRYVENLTVVVFVVLIVLADIQLKTCDQEETKCKLPFYLFRENHCQSPPKWFTSVYSTFVPPFHQMDEC